MTLRLTSGPVYFRRGEIPGFLDRLIDRESDGLNKKDVCVYKREIINESRKSGKEFGLQDHVLEEFEKDAGCEGSFFAFAVKRNMEALIDYLFTEHCIYLDARFLPQVLEAADKTAGNEKIKQRLVDAIASRLFSGTPVVVSDLKWKKWTTQAVCGLYHRLLQNTEMGSSQRACQEARKLSWIVEKAKALSKGEATAASANDALAEFLAVGICKPSSILDKFLAAARILEENDDCIDRISMTARIIMQNFSQVVGKDGEKKTPLVIHSLPDDYDIPLPAL